MSRLLTALLLAGIALVATASAAAAAGAYPPGQSGYDISWPQCSLGYPRLGADDLAVLGVTGGRPFRPNPCLRSQLDWGTSSGRMPSLYINTAFGLSSQGPLRCTADNDGCRAYNYGYLTAQYAYAYAYLNSFGRSLASPVWWLDVETANFWSGDTRLNAKVVEGALEFMHRAHVQKAGVYSTSQQWAKITGGAAPAAVPNWVAGAEGPDDVAKCVSPLWDGGEVWMIQYLVAEFDQDRSC